MPKDPDTTTVTPDMFEGLEDEGPIRDPHASVPGLPTPRKTRLWKCRVCGANLVDEAVGKCYNCGRDFYGEPGDVPAAIEKPRRPQIRSDGDGTNA